MSAPEVGSGLGMVEVRGVQGNEVGLAALVFGVTYGAFFGLIAVVAGLGRDAGSDLGVAGEALGGRDLARGHVTG
jgi:hypothetical protein